MMDKEVDYTLKLSAFAELTDIDIEIIAHNKEDLKLAIDLGAELIESYCDKKKLILLDKYSKEIESLRSLYLYD